MKKDLVEEFRLLLKEQAKAISETRDGPNKNLLTLIHTHSSISLAILAALGGVDGNLRWRPSK